VSRIVHEQVVSLEVIIEEERGQTVKWIDLRSLVFGKAISFAVQIQTANPPQKSEENTPEVQALTCQGCFHSLTACICEGTRFA
jgi:hypothetical protein